MSSWVDSVLVVVGITIFEFSLCALPTKFTNLKFSPHMSVEWPLIQKKSQQDGVC